MKVDVLNVHDLTDVSGWINLLERNPSLNSPFFRPEFSQLIGEVRPVQVALANDGSFLLPFHRHSFGIGKPVGNGISDYQGMVTAEGTNLDFRSVLKALGLRAFDFNHLLATQAHIHNASFHSHASPGIDLRQPFGSRKLSEHAANRSRKLHREIGPINFELTSTNAAHFEKCIQWKREQYARTGNYDVFNLEWVRHTFSRLLQFRKPSFQGFFSTLCAGDRLVAAHIGIRSGSVLHYWVPSYDPNLSVYSPGTILLLEVIAAAQDAGITLIDLGRGDQAYKARLANHETEVLEGFVSCDPIAHAIVQGRSAARALRRLARRGLARRGLKRTASVPLSQTGGSSDV